MAKKKARYSETEQQGMHAVEGAFLDMGWIKRPQHECDMGVDLIVEECKSGNPTGRLLGVQVKSGANYWKEMSSSDVTFRFDQTHYDYWLGHTLPILVVLFHPKSKKIIWEKVSAQTCEKAKNRWKICVPLAQSLTSRSIAEFSRLARPLTPQDLIKEKQRKFEALDPRFRATMIVSEQNAHTTFHAVEDVPLQFSFPGNPEEVAVKIDSLIERGRPVEFRPSEVSITGSPIFEHIWQDAKTVRLQIGTTINVSVFLSCTGDDGETRSDEVRIVVVPGRITAGKSRFTFELTDPAFPFKLSSEQAFAFSEDSSSIRDFGFSFDKWYGKPLLELPYYDQMEILARSLLKGNQLQIECQHEGAWLFSGKVKSKTTSPFGSVMEFIEFLNKARHVAKFLHLNPSFRELQDEEAYEILDLYDLVANGEHSVQVQSFSLSGQINVDAKFLELPEFINKDKPFQVTFELQQYNDFSFFGKKVNAGPIQLIATRVLLENHQEIFDILQRKTGCQRVRLDFKGCAGGQIVRRLIPPDKVTGRVRVKSASVGLE